MFAGGTTEEGGYPGDYAKPFFMNDWWYFLVKSGLSSDSNEYKLFKFKCYLPTDGKKGNGTREDVTKEIPDDVLKMISPDKPGSFNRARVITFNDTVAILKAGYNQPTNDKAIYFFKMKGDGVDWKHHKVVKFKDYQYSIKDFSFNNDFNKSY